MKFNEKLIELRRKEGLSQEELGYKLNVTRQTVSKWELGQTTPEMDKLIELGKIFNVSVDNLINNSEISKNKTTQIEDEPIINTENSKKEKNIKTIIIVIFVVIIISIIVRLTTILSIFNKTTSSQSNAENMFKNIFDTALNIINKAADNMEQTDNEINIETNKDTNEMNNEINNVYNQFKEEENKRENEQDIRNFNFYVSNGTNNGFFVKSTLDKIITSNKTNERKITLKYNGVETQDSDVIKETKKKIDDRKNYEISLDYDSEGYINLITIEDL